jgi:crossover junction endodeoxyribonuclease RuvC
LGLDPGLSATGYAIIDASDTAARPLVIGDIRTSPKDPLGKRLQVIHGEIVALVESHRPIAVSVEALFTRVNVKTVLQMAQARGVAILAATGHGAELAEYAPAEIKKLIAGTGRASKEQIEALVRSLVDLGEMKLSDHATDALAAALCHCRHRDFARASGGHPPTRPRGSTRRQLWTEAMKGRGG